MTPKERAEQIATAHYNKPVGNAAQDKSDLIAAIEQGMNEVLEQAEAKIGLEMFFYENNGSNTPTEQTTLAMLQGLQHAEHIVRALKSSDTPRNTITPEQKDEQ